MPVLHTPDLDMYYEITGKGSPLVLIHGLGSGVPDWEWQVAFLARHYQVITFDVRGHGRSGKPPGPYSVSLFAADTARLIRGLDLGPVHVAGLSMGGMIAFQLALDAPELVRRMVIINSGPEMILRTAPERMIFFHRELIIRFLGMRQLGKVLAKNLLPGPEHRRRARTLVERWAQNDKRAYLAALKALIGWSVAERIGGIQCPTLMMTADRDYTPVEWKRAVAAQMPRAEVTVIRQSRHLSPIDQPVQVNEALLSFLCAGG